MAATVLRVDARAPMKRAVTNPTRQLEILALRSALIEVNRGYNGSNNGAIVLSVRNMAERMGCAKDTAMRALQELADRKFIEPLVKGAYRRKFRHATEWRLTDRRCDATGAQQSQAFMKWQEPEPKTRKNLSQTLGHAVPNFRTQGNFPEQPSQSQTLGHSTAFIGPKIYDTSRSASLEGAVVLPVVLPAAGVEPAAAGIGHNAGPPLGSSDDRPVPATAAPDDLLEIPPFLRRA